MKKILKSILLIIPILIIIILVLNVSKLDKVFSFNENHGEQLYIYTADKAKNNFIQYNSASKRKKRLLITDKKDYPTAAYDESKNEVYFTYVTKNQTNQLFKKDLNSNKIEQLTNQFSHVDFLELDKKKQLLFMRILKDANSRNFQIASYNIKNKQTVIWNKEDKDNSVKFINYNPKLEQLLVVSNSLKEEQEKIKKANEKGIYPKPPVYHLSIYNKDGEKIQDMILKEKFITGASLSSDGKYILISYLENLEKKPMSKIETVDLESKHHTLLLKDSTELSNLRTPQFNKNNTGFYFLADIDKTVQINNVSFNTSTINYYDLKKKTVSRVWSQKDGITINFYVER